MIFLIIPATCIIFGLGFLAGRLDRQTNRAETSLDGIVAVLRDGGAL